PQLVDGLAPQAPLCEQKAVKRARRDRELRGGAQGAAEPAPERRVLAALREKALEEIHRPPGRSFPPEKEAPAAPSNGREARRDAEFGLEAAAVPEEGAHALVVAQARMRLDHVHLGARAQGT